mgnify:CR=1 FL=1
MMTFDELLTKVRGMSGKIDISGTDFLAIQVNIKGENGGVFYIEIKDKRINVEPYEYNDRSCALTMTNPNFNKLIDGKLDPVAAFTLGKLKVDGDIGKALEFAKLIKK